MRIRRITLALVVAAWLPASAATLLVANKTDNTVDLVDAATGRSRATLRTGSAPHEIAVSPDGRFAVVSNYGTATEPGSTLTVVDVLAAKNKHTIKLKKHTRPHGMVWFAADRLAVTTEGSSHLLIVDPMKKKILLQIPTAQRVSHMVAVTPDDKRAFVANIGSGTVTVIDLAEGRFVQNVATGVGAEGIAITPDGKEVWVLNRGADTIAIIDPSSLKVPKRILCKGFPIRIVFTPDGKRALVSCAKTGEVVLIDVASRREIARRKLDLSTVPEAASRLFGDRFGESPAPVGIVVSPDGKRAYVAATQADVVVVLDTETLDVVDLWKAGREPDGMAYSSAGAPAGS